MIRVVGFKRIVLLLVLAAVNVLFAAAIYGYIIPENVTSEGKLQTLQRQIATKQSDIERMQIEFEQLDKQQGQFDVLKEDGFFIAQDRTMAREALNQIQDQARVISAVASIDPGVLDNNEEAQKANHKILVSPIEIEIKAFDDGDVYSYIDIMEKTFPGHVSIDSIEIRRTRDVSAAVLRAIATGANPELVSAKLALSWRTMIPQDQVIPEDGK